YGLAIGSNGTLTCVIVGSGSVPITTMVTTTTIVPVGPWTHVACTYDGTTTNVYVNGSVAGTHSGSGSVANGANDMRLAGGFPSGYTLVGLIDQFRLLNVARSAAEICVDAGRTSCP